MTVLKISTYQGSSTFGNLSNSLDKIKRLLEIESQANVDILCFPECFLQGYLLDESIARKASINLDSLEFKNILATLYSLKTTIIMGLIERTGSNIYNTAIVIEKGRLIGSYWKRNLLPKEIFFTPGNTMPVFSKKNIKYGINICSDTRNSIFALELSKLGAKVLFFPLNNSLPHKTADKWKDKHLDYWINRAKESACWVITSDVIEKSSANTGYGFTTIIDPTGKVIKAAKHFKEEILRAEIKL